MKVTAKNWKNKGGTKDRSCTCGTWREHWLNNSDKLWPSKCSVSGCDNAPTLGGHIINTNVSGEKIVPMCYSCNNSKGEFDLKGGVRLVSANKAKTCEK